jgi:hypothetical protein
MNYSENYLIVLFKNKRKKKIINKFKTHKRAKEFFDNLLSESNSVIFDKQYENGVKSKYEIAILERMSGTMLPIFLKDELGRNIKVELDDENYKIIKIEDYKEDEYILDYSNSNKLTTKEFIKTFLDPSGFKLISKLNNKIIVQNDDKINLFTLKNEDDSLRFVDSLSEYFRLHKRFDCIFVKDYSTQQRKYLYELLVNNGFPKSYLVRRSTTHPVKT